MSARQTDRKQEDGNGLVAALPANERERRRITEIQRARMVAAAIRVTAEVGAHNLTVADVVGEAGVSRRTFYEIFEDCEDCFLAAFEEAVARVAERILPIWRESARWQQRTRSVIAAILRLFDDEPSTARFLVVEAMGAGPRALARRQEVIDALIAAIDEVRDDSQAAEAAPCLTAEGVLGGVLSILHARLLELRERPLVELVNPLMSMIVMPYLGNAAARREMERPTQGAPDAVAAPEERVLRTLGMRVTYRTARTLAAVAEHAGASNRAIGDAAGISDQGQVSKLLGRLERYGLVENAGVGGATRGAPNAWRLTRRGEEVRHVLAADSRV
jgi:AcrR family transcriptional regulator